MLSAKQNEYIRNSNKRWNIKTGATQSGKTFLDYYYTIPARIRERAGKDGLNFILGVSKSTIERNILEPMRNIYGASLVSDINSQNMARLFGEDVHCLGAEKVSQVSKLRGASVKYCYGDEVADWNPEVFQMLKSRLSKPYSCFDGALNPQSPTHWMKEFIDSDIDIYTQQYTIFDNPFLSKEYIENLCKEYDGTVYYDRYILGKWKRAEGVIYTKYADRPQDFIVGDELDSSIKFGIIGVDFGGTISAHSFTFTGFTDRFKETIVRMEYYRKEQISPDTLYKDFGNFVRMVQAKFKCTQAYCDSAESTLIKGLQAHCLANRIPISVENAKKTSIKGRIDFEISQMGIGAFKVHESCTHTSDALQNAVYDDKSSEDKRLDDGKINIDSLDSMEYSFEPVMDLVILANGGR